MAQSKKSYKLNENNEIVTEGNLIEPTKCIGVILFEKMIHHKDAVAQIQTETGEEQTYGSIHNRSVRTALYLKSRGIIAGDVISICTNNNLDSCVPIIASQFIGAITAALDPSLSHEEMKHLINITKPKIIFTIPESFEKIEQTIKTYNLPSEIIVLDKIMSSNTDASNGYSTSFSQLMNEPMMLDDEEKSFKPLEITDLTTTALIHFSSGSTGLPKAICLSHYSIVSQLQIDDEKGTKPASSIRALSITSFYWVSATLTLVAATINGMCRLLVLNFNPNEIWFTLSKYKPLFVMLTPVFALEMIASGRPENIDLTGWKILILAGSKITAENVKKIKAIIPEVEIYQGYGQTEVSGGLSSFQSGDPYHRMMNAKKPGSVGLPVRGVTYRVVDIESDETVGPNKTGELQIKSKLLMKGYYNGEDSSASFTKDGWFKTGDLIYYDEDLCFYVVDRIKESFKYRSWFIAPALIESKLQQHPAVKHCVVIGIPHDDGEHPMGVVVLKDEYSGDAATAEEIEKFVEERVSDRQRLRAGVRFIKEMPLSVTGKIKKWEVGKMFRNV